MCMIYVAHKHFFFPLDLVPMLKTLLITGLEPSGRCRSNITEHNSVNKRSTHKQKWRSLLKSNTHILNARPRKLHLFHSWSSFDVDIKPFIRFYRLNFVLWQNQTLKCVMQDNILVSLIKLLNIRCKLYRSSLYHQTFQKLEFSPPPRHCGSTRAKASSFWRFLDHTRRTTVGRTPVDEW